MCYSIEIEKDIQKIAKLFQVERSREFENWYKAQKEVASDFEYIKKALSLSRKPTTHMFKEPGNDSRIYPGYFTDVIVEENGQRILKKMRYRIRPSGSREEIPSKYNVFNARIDSLEKRQTWQKIFSNKHGLIPFTRFFEWVERDGKKVQISFHPKERELMWAPCLFDFWESPDKKFGFFSFAIITDDPPPEVLSEGHDRCPIFLQESQIDAWLSPKGKTKTELYEILKSKEETYYLNQLIAA